MARFRCFDCGQRSANVIGCRRCGSTKGRRTELCPMHGAACRPGCRTCRIRFRAQSHA
ncbi:hypothetical protein [Nonomuraea dietziae]|uniref:Uncharacterized protein n=1 Tax=Nonomuraea dietziae TaxID=65515 RepID=A0A7W5VEN6_9ACTN|nr:hypothetical protein [Nonomuraea dietziae]MBB3730075.1 hypothetical protein [Nonomuraea dietziae]